MNTRHQLIVHEYWFDQFVEGLSDLVSDPIRWSDYLIYLITCFDQPNMKHFGADEMLTRIRDAINHRLETGYWQ